MGFTTQEGPGCQNYRSGFNSLAARKHHAPYGVFPKNQFRYLSLDKLQPLKHGQVPLRKGHIPRSIRLNARPLNRGPA